MEVGRRRQFDLGTELGRDEQRRALRLGAEPRWQRLHHGPVLRHGLFRRVHVDKRRRCGCVRFETGCRRQFHVDQEFWRRSGRRRLRHFRGPGRDRLHDGIVSEFPRLRPRHRGPPTDQRGQHGCIPVDTARERRICGGEQIRRHRRGRGPRRRGGRRPVDLHDGILLRQWRFQPRRGDPHAHQRRRYGRLSGEARCQPQLCLGRRGGGPQRRRRECGGVGTEQQRVPQRRVPGHGGLRSRSRDVPSYQCRHERRVCVPVRCGGCPAERKTRGRIQRRHRLWLGGHARRSAVPDGSLREHRGFRPRPRQLPADHLRRQQHVPGAIRHRCVERPRVARRQRQRPAGCRGSRNRGGRGPGLSFPG